MNVETKFADELLLLKDAEKREPLLCEPDSKYDLYHVKSDKELYEMYKKMQRSNWPVEEVDISEDAKHFQEAAEEDQFFLENALGFFFRADGQLSDYVERVQQKVKLPVAKLFYAWKNVNEIVHAEGYGLQIDTVVSDETTRFMLFNAIDTVPVTKAKGIWAQKWLGDDMPFAVQNLASLAAEGLLFTSSFACIDYIKTKYNKKFVGITSFNDMISRDENLHASFESLLARQYIKTRASTELAHAIFQEATELEIAFNEYSLSCPNLKTGPNDQTSSKRMLGINAEDMALHVKIQANKMLTDAGYPPLFKGLSKTTPFKWMAKRDLPAKANFFERTPTEYQDTHKQSENGHGIRFGDDTNF